MAVLTDLILTDSQRDELTAISQSRSLPAGYVFRARLILMLAEGLSFATVQRQLQTTAPTIIRWKERFIAQGIDGLDTYHPGQPPTILTPALRARILAATRKKPIDGSTHWSCRKLAARLGVSKDTVHRVWKEAGLKPHRMERYLASDDPEFETKAADIIGLYLHPPQHAAVYLVDKKTAIQALDRLDPVLRSAPAAPSDTVSNTIATARFRSTRLWTRNPAKCWARPRRHTSQEFVDSSAKSSSEKAGKSASFSTIYRGYAPKYAMATHPPVHFHFTRTYFPGSIRSKSGFQKSNGM